MAIYKNREVSFVAPVRSSHQAEHITVIYKDNTHENVALSQVRFTEEEKKNLLKDYPSRFDNVETISEDDLKAVRIGVAPASDPSYKEQAEVQVRHQKQVEENQKMVDYAKKEAEKNFDKKVNANTSKTEFKVTPQSPTGVYQKKSNG